MEGHYSVYYSGGGVQDIQLPRSGEREIRIDFFLIHIISNFKERQRGMFNPKEKSSMVRLKAHVVFKSQ